MACGVKRIPDRPGHAELQPDAPKEVLQGIRDRLENGREQPSRNGAAGEANDSDQDKPITPTSID